MPNQKLTQLEPRYFSLVFSKKLDEWLTNNPKKSQTDFADKIKIKQRNNISMYKNGTRLPGSETFKEICKAFKCSPSDFFRGNHPSTYKYSQSHQNAVTKEQLVFVDNIDLSLSFIDLLREKSDFNNFPMYSSPCLTFDNTLSRQTIADSDAIDSSDYFYIRHKEKNCRLSNEDLLFMRDLQNEIIDLINKKYKLRQKELDSELKSLQKKVFLTDKNGLEVVKFYDDMIINHDRYSKLAHEINKNKGGK